MTKIRGYNLILPGLLILLAVAVSAGFRVDYTADSYSCSAHWDDPAHGCDKVYDNDLDTYGSSDTYGDFPCTLAYIYMNYTIPAGVNQTGSYLKLTLPSDSIEAEIPLECWNVTGESTVILSASSSYSPTCSLPFIRAYCYNGTGNEQIGSYPSGAGRISDDAMYFNDSSYDIGRCVPPNDQVAISIDIVNESDFNPALAKVGFSYYLYNQDYTYVSNSSINFTGVSSYQICLREDTTEGYLDIIARHENSSFRIEDYIKRKLYITNESKNFTVYMLPDDDNDYDVLFTVQDYTGTVYVNYLVEAYKKDFYSNSYRLVDTELTGNSGEVTMALDLIDQFYVMRVRDQMNNLVYQSSAMKIVDTENTIIIQTQEDQSFLREFLSVKQGTYTMTLNPGETRVYLDYYLINSEDTCLVLRNYNSTGVHTIGTNCSNSTGNFLSLAIPGNSTTTAFTMALINDRNYTLDTLDINNVADDGYGQIKLFMGFMIVLLAGLAGAVSTVVGLVSVVFALIIVNLMGLVPIGYSAIVGFIIIALVIILGKKKRGAVI